MKRVLRRFSDRAKAPRRWWFPIPCELRKRDPEVLEAEHEQCSETIRRIMLTLLAFSVFSLVAALGTPDRSLVGSSETLRLPIVGVDIAFTGFLIVAPIVIIGLTIYLHIFIGYWLRLESEWNLLPESSSKEKKLITIFNLNQFLPSLISAFIFYWLPPLVLAVMSWKSLVRLEWGIPMGILTLILASGLIFIRIRRCPDHKRRQNNLRWFTLLLFLIVSIWVGIDEYRVQRPFDLFRADLRGAWLEGIDLTSASISFANLSGANLRRAHLENASLEGANLTEVDLSGAFLRKAYFGNANLSGANLSRSTAEKTSMRSANLTEANLQQAYLGDSVLVGADLTNADLTGANLSEADLTNAKIIRANLAGANLAYAKLINANFTGACLNGIILEGADLSGAVLKNASLGTANLHVSHIWQNRVWYDSAQLLVPRGDLDKIRYEDIYLTVPASLRKTQGLSCDQIRDAKDWDKALRDIELSCGSKIQ